MVKIYIEDSKKEDKKDEIREQLSDTETCMYLGKNDWDDFGYKTKYNLHFLTKNSTEYIGAIKIGHNKMNYDSPNIDEFLKKATPENYLQDKLDEEFYSLAQSEKFYQKLQEHCKNKQVINFLKEIRELTTLDNNELSKIQEQDVYEASLIRDENEVFTAKFLKIINNIIEYQKVNNNEADKYAYNLLVKLYDKVTKSESNYLDNEYKYYKYLVENIDDLKLECKSKILKDIKELNYDNNSLVNKINEITASSDRLKEKINEKIKEIEDQIFLTEDDIDEISLGHYTSLETLKYLLAPINLGKNHDESKVGNFLRLSHYKQMNDPLEGEVLKEYLFNSEKVNSTSETLGQNSYYYVSAATTESDSLPMWKQYADDAQGLFLEYSEQYLKDIIKHGEGKIAKVYYLDINDKNERIKCVNREKAGKCNKENNEQDILILLKDLKDLINEGNKEVVEEAKSRSSELFLCFKNIDYAYENEYRIIVNKEDRTIDIILGENMCVPRLYTYLDQEPLVYSKVILGSKCIHSDYVAPYIEHCAGMNKNKEINIQRSKIEYR